MNQINIAFFDTGIYPHQDFEHRIYCFQDFVNRKKFPYDDNGHGTHVAGIACGSGKLSGGKIKGADENAGIVMCKVLDEKGNGKIQWVLEAMDWILNYHKLYQIRIINFSVGTVELNSKYAKELVRGVERLWDAGLIVVVAAGNLGPYPGSVTAPGNSKKVITVGCYDINNTQRNPSGRGPTEECICKPDIVAKGYEIFSCAACKQGDCYKRKSGTSMATPYISGCIAKKLEKEPELSNIEIKMKLHQSCRDLGLPTNLQGWGVLDEKLFLF